jgi:hypothetical protein
MQVPVVPRAALGRGAAGARGAVSTNPSASPTKPSVVGRPSLGSAPMALGKRQWLEASPCQYTCVAGTCGQDSKRVFVTSVLYNGNLGGLDGADMKCQTLAMAAGLPGTYRAWLSDFDHSPSTRFSKAGGPYILVDGSIIANNWTALVSGSALRRAIDLTDTGGAPPATGKTCGNVNRSVWTNTRDDGTLANPSYTCSDWTSSTGTASWWGRSDHQSSWTLACSGGNSAEIGCGSTSSLYCFQQ